MKIELVIKYNDEYYRQPNCKMKIDAEGNISMFVKIGDLFQPANGEIVNIKFKV